MGVYGANYLQFCLCFLLLRYFPSGLANVDEAFAAAIIE